MSQSNDARDAAEELTNRQILLELRATVAHLAEQVTEAAHHTNPLPLNFKTRFSVMEERLSRIERKLNTMALDTYDVHTG